MEAGAKRPRNASTPPPPPTRRKVNVLVFLTPVKPSLEILPYLRQRPEFNLRVISNYTKKYFQQCMKDGSSLEEVQFFQNFENSTRNQMRGHRLARWADLLFVVMDASMIAHMLIGYPGDVVGHILRCWDISKRIVLLPELSVDQAKHPIWSRQLSKINRNWEWVHVVTLALWDFSSPLDYSGDDSGMVWHWQGPGEVFEAINAEAQVVLHAEQSETTTSLTLDFPSPRRPSSNKPCLPSEIWTVILDHHGDWEMATALGVYTHLPVPYEWANLIPRPDRQITKSLEYTILTQPTSAVKKYFDSLKSPPSTLSPLATKIIFKHSLTCLLTYLVLHQKDIFYPSFGLASLPHKASLIYNSPAILQWWKSCPAVIQKEYGPEALDGASRAGFVDVLDWWLHSGLRMHYTEKALESAAAKGHVNVLEWWKHASELRSKSTNEGNQEEEELPLKPGKSILLAAQSGRVASLTWFHHSGIPFNHEDGVARLASTHGHVDVLEAWCALKGSKMIFDNTVLVGATKNGHAKVLEWWKKASKEHGFLVEYKTCDIEEAMEDAVGGGGEGEVRDWWARNGLNLGVGTGEWMRVKTL